MKSTRLFGCWRVGVNGIAARTIGQAFANEKRGALIVSGLGQGCGSGAAGIASLSPAPLADIKICMHESDGGGE